MELRASRRKIIYTSEFNPLTGAIVRAVEHEKQDSYRREWELTDEQVKRYERRQYGSPWSPTPETVDISITDKCGFGCSYCLTPETPILGEDLVWRPISEVQEGTVLVGFDEFREGNQKRKLRPSIVEAVRTVKKDVLRIVTDAREILTTGNHGWLEHRKERGHRWQAADQLLVGSALCFFGEPFKELETTDDYRLGYLAGMTLGDGTFRFEPGWGNWAQGFPQSYWRVALKDEAALGRLVAYLASFGVEAYIRPFDPGTAGFPGNMPMQKVEVRSIPKLEVIHKLVNCRLDSYEYKRGFLAGFFDAEGAHDDNLRYHQKDTAPLLRVIEYGAALGFTFKLEEFKEDVASARLVGTVSDRMRFLGTIRPAIHQKTMDWVDTSLATKAEVIQSIEKVGKREVVDIQTSTATFFASGCATHNCYQDSRPRRRHAPKELVEQVIKGFDVPPYQIAIGGGEPTEHPDFPEILRKARELGTVPNYTTNGAKLLPEIVEATNEVCGGVAMTFHAFKGLDWFIEHYLALKNALKVQVNVHVIADQSVAKNIDALISRISETGPLRIVLLAYYPDVGRATFEGIMPKQIYMKDLPEAIMKALEVGYQIAFSEGMLPFILSRPEMGIRSDFFMRSEGYFSCYFDSKGRISESSFRPARDDEEKTVWNTKSQELWDKLDMSFRGPEGDKCYYCKHKSRCATPHEFHYLSCAFAEHNDIPLRSQRQLPVLKLGTHHGSPHRHQLRFRHQLVLDGLPRATRVLRPPSGQEVHGGLRDLRGLRRGELVGPKHLRYPRNDQGAEAGGCPKLPAAWVRGLPPPCDRRGVGRGSHRSGRRAQPDRQHAGSPHQPDPVTNRRRLGRPPLGGGLQLTRRLPSQPLPRPHRSQPGTKGGTHHALLCDRLRRGVPSCPVPSRWHPNSSSSTRS